MTDTAVIVLAAGQGTRMKSRLAKVLHPLAGRAMLGHVLAALDELKPRTTVLVLAPGMEEVARHAGGASIAIQERPLGTGDAARAALPALAGFGGGVLVVFGDTPLLTPATLVRLRHALDDGTAIGVLGFRPADTAQYGRLVLDGDGALTRIVEHRDATEAERAIPWCNAGAMAISGIHLRELLAGLTNANAKGEYYLTDIVALALAQGLAARVVEADADEVLGVNDKAELAQAEAILQRRLRARALEAGVTMQDPASVFLCADTTFGQDVTIGPNVVFGPGVVVGSNVTIKAFSHVEGADIGAGSVIGPFARLRPGTVLETDVHIGNFVELKATRMGTGAKANHLAYVGDASVGARANIGAGTITCNYDGFDKWRTVIGEDAFIGSNTALVAPVTVGDRAITAAGSTIVRDVPEDALALARGKQEDKVGWAHRFRLAGLKRKARRAR
ncbi:bifunctional UDP-N-acetylglucosamine diphosphorylase/glucosamine-1-phosphate N-acetyltransferase GlmU [Zavarzinia sp. CC-PAN008]|uniref:bifunctional UDP-N-acetylglucosamine diphosphorylase/glucosamine-1-phosphate N-acetyltransferase GlmU n=1 Tax=Zavarzinia sp. CC-PAN008 TaxID=3243332 RepID=UPI003F745275